MIGTINQYLDDAKMSLELARQAIQTELTELQPGDGIASTPLIEAAVEISKGLVTCVQVREKLDAAIAQGSPVTRTSSLRLSCELILAQLRSIYEGTKANLPDEVKREFWQRKKFDPNVFLSLREHHPEDAFALEVMEALSHIKGHLDALLMSEASKDILIEQKLKLGKMRRYI